MDQATARLQNIGSQIANTNVGETATNAVQNISQTLTNATAGLKEFSSQTAVNASQSFLDSNSIIAKFVFLIFILVMFMVVVNLGISFITYLMQPSKSPYIIQGLINGNANITVFQDPKNGGSATVYRSNNEKNGIEATWAFWMYIDSIDLNNTNKYLNVFNKGNNVYDSTTGVATVNNGPGVYLCPGKNKLRIYLDETNRNQSNAGSYTEIENLPIKKWFHVVIRIQGRTLDTYLNGMIADRKIISTVPKQNYDPVYVGWNGGFSGKLSNVKYHNYALGIFDINNIVMRGPNLTESSAVKSNSGNYTYLSTIWYSNRLASSA